MLPRFIILAILINIVPSFIPIQGMDTVRNIANIIFVLAFLIVVIKHAQQEATSSKSHHDPSGTTTSTPPDPNDNRTLFK